MSWENKAKLTVSFVRMIKAVCGREPWRNYVHCDERKELYSVMLWKKTFYYCRVAREKSVVYVLSGKWDAAK
jgi:hypothetical protein